MISGIELITEERKRQIEKEGWTPEHDDEHVNEEIALAAACYVTPQNHLKFQPEGFFRGEGDFKIPTLWPWAAKWYKPSPDPKIENRIIELVKSGALIAAEIDRLQRALAENKAKAESE